MERLVSAPERGWCSTAHDPVECIHRQQQATAERTGRRESGISFGTSWRVAGPSSSGRRQGGVRRSPKTSIVPRAPKAAKRNCERRWRWSGIVSQAYSAAPGRPSPRHAALRPGDCDRTLAHREGSCRRWSGGRLARIVCASGGVPHLSDPMAFQAGAARESSQSRPFRASGGGHCGRRCVAACPSR